MGKDKNEEKTEAKVVEKQPTQNGITRPKPGTQTGRVWEIADEISAEQGSPADRKAVVETFVSESGNPATGATQYGRWRKFHGIGPVGRAAKVVAEDEAEVEE